MLLTVVVGAKADTSTKLQVPFRPISAYFVPIFNGDEVSGKTSIKSGVTGDDAKYYNSGYVLTAQWNGIIIDDNSISFSDYDGIEITFANVSGNLQIDYFTDNTEETATTFGKIPANTSPQTVKFALPSTTKAIRIYNNDNAGSTVSYNGTDYENKTTFTVSSIYLFKRTKVTDEVFELKLADAKTLEGSPTVDGAKITWGTGADKFGWELAEYDLSNYKYLVVVPRRPWIHNSDTDEDGQVNYILSDASTKYNNWEQAWGNFQQRRASVVDQANHYRWNTSTVETNNTTADATTVTTIDLSKVSQFYFTGETANKDYEISAVYFTNQQPKYTNNWNATDHSTMSDYAYETTEKDQYRTVCLPYAAAVCGAYAYEVVGVDSKENPSKLYLQEVNGILEAGKPYIVKSICSQVSTDFKESQITFYKAGSTTVSTPVSTTGLVGSFNESTAVPSGSYILKDGSWVTGSNNTIAANHAYLTLTDDLVVTSSEAKKMGFVEMSVVDGTVTGINNMKAAASDNAPIYNLSGVRVSNPTKGVYVKNGKKFVVK